MPTKPYYLKDGTRVPGVTTVLGNLGWNARALKHWAWKEGIAGRDYRMTQEEAADVGTHVHLMAESHLSGKPMPPWPKAFSEEQRKAALNAFDAFLSWLGETRIKIVASEVSLVSETWRYGGTMDAVGQDPTGRHVIIDFKASNDTYVEHLVQLAGYGELWNGHHPEALVSVYYLLRFGKETGSFHYHRYPDLRVAWEAFEHALALHRIHQTLQRIS